LPSEMGYFDPRPYQNHSGRFHHSSMQGSFAYAMAPPDLVARARWDAARSRAGLSGTPASVATCEPGAHSVARAARVEPADLRLPPKHRATSGGARERERRLRESPGALSRHTGFREPALFGASDAAAADDQQRLRSTGTPGRIRSHD